MIGEVVAAGVAIGTKLSDGKTAGIEITASIEVTAVTVTTSSGAAATAFVIEFAASKRANPLRSHRGQTRRDGLRQVRIRRDIRRAVGRAAIDTSIEPPLGAIVSVAPAPIVSVF